MNSSVKRNAIMIGSAAAVGGFAAALFSRGRPLDLRGKVVLITGGSRGLGLGLARAFAQHGSSLVICARSVDELNAAKLDLARHTANVLTVPCDVSDRSQVDGLISAALERYGRIDVLVNNAGAIQVGPVDTMTVEDFERAMGIMFWGVVYPTLAVLPQMRRLRQARIVNITSVGGKVSVPHLVPYSCAKFAAVAFSEGLHAELHGTGIKVVTIAPGLMRTGSFLNAEFKGDADAEAAWFSASSSLPGLTISGERAAAQILESTRTGRAERILTTPANLLSRFHGLFPGATSEILGLINHLLPHDGGETRLGSETSTVRNPVLYALTTLGRHAAKRFLQPGVPSSRVRTPRPAVDPHHSGDRA